MRSTHSPNSDRQPSNQPRPESNKPSRQQRLLKILTIALIEIPKIALPWLTLAEKLPDLIQQHPIEQHQQSHPCNAMPKSDEVHEA